MQADNTNNSRTICLMDLPFGYDKLMSDVGVTVNFTTDTKGSDFMKDMLMETIVIPAILKALNTPNPQTPTTKYEGIVCVCGCGCGK